jgi:hypothetical protein
MSNPQFHGSTSGGAEAAKRTAYSASTAEVVMPRLEITGLAQETDFTNPEKTITILLINKGELRLRIDESSVPDLLQYALNGHSNGVSESTEEQTAGQEEEPEAPPEDDEDGPTDETGVPSI